MGFKNLAYQKNHRNLKSFLFYKINFFKSCVCVLTRAHLRRYVHMSTDVCGD